MNWGDSRENKKEMNEINIWDGSMIKNISNVSE